MTTWINNTKRAAFTATNQSKNSSDWGSPQSADFWITENGDYMVQNSSGGRIILDYQRVETAFTNLPKH